MSDVKLLADICSAIATSIAIIVGGGWVLYQFVIRRSGQTGLSIDFETRTLESKSNKSIQFLDIILKNVGFTRLDASLDSPEWLAKNYENSIHHAGSLQIRKIKQSAELNLHHINWWARDSDLEPDLYCDVDFLMEYSNEDTKPDFFMEPGEEYHFGNLFTLENGTYLAKVVFVGQRYKEFWSRIFTFHVTTQPISSTAHADS